MTETWFDRLARAVERDPRSMREISTTAGCGPNYLQQLLRDRKEPGVDRFLRITSALGTASALYIMTGADFTREDEEFFRLVLGLPPRLRADALQFFRSLQVGEGN